MRGRGRKAKPGISHPRKIIAPAIGRVRTVCLFSGRDRVIKAPRLPAPADPDRSGIRSFAGNRRETSLFARPVGPGFPKTAHRNRREDEDDDDLTDPWPGIVVVKERCGID